MSFLGSTILNIRTALLAVRYAFIVERIAIGEEPPYQLEADACKWKLKGFGAGDAFDRDALLGMRSFHR
jgi:hypothetical protein